MKIQDFSQQGKRSNNEDSVGFNAGLLTVCDGIGGHVSGERASAFVVEAMLKAFDQPRPLGKMDIQQQLNKVQTDLNKLLETEPELEKMGTTFTGVFITPDVWYAAHIGDSRIYLFRPSEQKLWHTWDHSLVGELMRTHEITVEAGRFHPMSNRISKAIMAQRDGKLASASIVKIDQLKAGDILLLCSDGVIEGWGDLELVKLFSDASLSFEQKCQKLRQQCAIQSKDNNTALIAEIEESDAINFGNNDELEWTTFAQVEADYQKYMKENSEVTEEPAPQPSFAQPLAQEAPAQRPTPQPTPRTAPQALRSGNGSLLKRILIPVLIALIVILGVGLFLLLRNGSKKDEAKPEDQIENVIDNPENTNPDALTSEPAGNPVDMGQMEEEAQRKVEDELFNKCNTIAGCDAYLNAFPHGRYEDQVRQKRSELIEDEAYKKCTTIEGCRAYLSSYPHGRYVSQVKKKLNQMEAAAQQSNRVNGGSSTPPKTNEDGGGNNEMRNDIIEIINGNSNNNSQNANGSQGTPNQQINNAVNQAIQQGGGGQEPNNQPPANQPNGNPEQPATNHNPEN